MESAVEKKFIKVVKSLGGTPLKLNTSSGNGYPDRENLYPGAYTDFAEIKDGEDKIPDPIQIIRRRELMELGFSVYWIKTETDIENYRVDHKIRIHNLMWIAKAQTDRKQDNFFDIKDPLLKAEFAAAQIRVVNKAGTCDGGLSSGYLDCKASRLFFAEALNMDFTAGLEFPQDIAPGDVFDAWISCGTNPRTTVLPWAYHSVKEFLRVCAKYKLGVTFP